MGYDKDCMRGDEVIGTTHIFADSLQRSLTNHFCAAGSMINKKQTKQDFTNLLFGEAGGPGFVLHHLIVNHGL